MLVSGQEEADWLIESKQQAAEHQGLKISFPKFRAS